MLFILAFFIGCSRGDETSSLRSSEQNIAENSNKVASKQMDDFNKEISSLSKEIDENIDIVSVRTSSSVDWSSDSNLVITADGYQLTPLILLLMKGDTKSAEELLKKGADVNKMLISKHGKYNAFTYILNSYFLFDNNASFEKAINFLMNNNANIIFHEADKIIEDFSKSAINKLIFINNMNLLEKIIDKILEIRLSRSIARELKQLLPRFTYYKLNNDERVKNIEDENMIKLLLNKSIFKEGYNFNMRRKDYINWTPFAYAVVTGNVKIAELLFNKFKSNKQNFNYSHLGYQKRFITKLFMTNSIVKDKIDVNKILLKDRQETNANEINHLSTRLNRAFTPMDYALFVDDKMMIEFLEKCNAQTSITMGF